MLASLDEFEYFECNFCGCLQIKYIPNNINRYYESYYTKNKKIQPISKFRKYLWGIRRIGYLSIFHKLFKLISPNSILEWCKVANIKKNKKVLDVGCGNGDILYEFSKHGFNNLYGTDPLLPEETINRDNINYYKGNFKNLNWGSFDFIMMNHSFEHIEEPNQILEGVVKILKKDAILMLRIPIKNKAFETYKENWYQLDAPRHFYLHTPKSVHLLAKKYNLKLLKTIYDSTFMQFIGSIEYSKNIYYNSPEAFRNNPSKSIFDENEIEKYKKLANSYNKKKLGDQAAYFFKIDN